MIQLSNNININGLTFSSVNPNIYNEYSVSKDAEVFENVVFDLMLNKYSEDKELTEYVLSLPKEQQRMAVLSLIDDDNNLWTKMNTFVDECNDELEHIKDVIKIMFKFVKDGEVEKKKFGEVMTPLELVKEMLSTLPKDVWSNPNLKWLDPCNGAGTFPLVVIYKLMKGLSEWEPNVEKRYKHIVENMIYTCELQSRNVFLWLCGVDPKDKYTTNTYWGSFLDSELDIHMKDVWDIEKFDIIIMNPPYQTSSNNKGVGHTLWDKFVLKSIDLIKDNGYLVAVHPSGWRGISKTHKPIKNKLTSMEMIYLETHDIKDGLETFKAATDYDFYCVRKSINNEFKTKVVSKDGVQYLDLSKMDFIPNGMFDKIYDLVAKDGDDKVTVLASKSFYESRKKWVSKSKSDEYIYPCVGTILQNGEPRLYYSSKKDNGFFGTPKVIWSNGKGMATIKDYDGDYGMCEFAYAIADDIENFDNISKCFASQEFSDMMKIANVGFVSVNPKIIATFRKDFWKEFI